MIHDKYLLIKLTYIWQTPIARLRNQQRFIAALRYLRGQQTLYPTLGIARKLAPAGMVLVFMGEQQIWARRIPVCRLAPLLVVIWLGIVISD